MLHITNGDSVVQTLRAGGISGTLLPWRDVLHEGPVPAGLSQRDLSRARAGFIVDQGWGKATEVQRSFDERDSVLQSWRQHDEVVLWFEHDLYDQLQLIQILDFFADSEPDHLQLICIDHHPEVEPFHGLGQLTPAQLAALFDHRRAVTREQLKWASGAWRDFRNPDPSVLNPWFDNASDTSDALPFLAAALHRHAEQFPSTVNGLGRTEQQILEGARSGLQNAVDLFHHDQDREENPFLGDLIFQAYLERLASGEHPLLDMSLSDDEGARAASPLTGTALTLTTNGHRVLAEELDRVHLCGVDFWLGGVHLTGRDIWRWDTAALARPSA